MVIAAVPIVLLLALVLEILWKAEGEELKAGAKIEVIKPEDVEKREREEAQKAEKKTLGW